MTRRLTINARRVVVTSTLVLVCLIVASEFLAGPWSEEHAQRIAISRFNRVISGEIDEGRFEGPTRIYDCDEGYSYEWRARAEPEDVLIVVTVEDDGDTRVNFVGPIEEMRNSQQTS